MIIMPLAENHIDQLADIERRCFNTPWTKQDFERELFDNKLAIYFIALDNNIVQGYAGMWHVVNEGHITNIAVVPEKRGNGVASLLLGELIRVAVEFEMIGLTLEVNINNVAAQKLYTKFGFKAEAIRKGYYSYNESKEDAIIMWKYF